MKLCAYVDCGQPGEWFAETNFETGVVLCQRHYDEAIARAIADNPDINPFIVRSAMERASYPIQLDRKDS